MRQRLPFLLELVRGAIGKEFVIKHYRYGIIKTKFPDMSRIVASESQRKCRNLFKEAVAYALEIISDKERKQQWQKRLRKRNAVYNNAVKYYMLKDKRAKEAAMLEVQRLLRIALKNENKNLITTETTNTFYLSHLNKNQCQIIKNIEESRIGSG